MTDLPRLTPARHAKQAEREARRARALRDNLRRRKEQARARQPPAAPTAADEPADDEPAA